MNPREWDNYTIIVYNHRRYILWDYELPVNWTSFWNDFQIYISNQYDIDWVDPDDLNDESYKLIDKFIKDNIIYKPISLYDHSWITLSTWIKTWWDSGQVWYIYIHRDDIHDLLWVDAIHTDHINRVKQILDEEITEYSRWLWWHLYQYEIKSMDDYCWWFDSVGGAYEEAIKAIDDFEWGKYTTNKDSLTSMLEIANNIIDIAWENIYDWNAGNIEDFEEDSKILLDFIVRQFNS